MNINDSKEESESSPNWTHASEATPDSASSTSPQHNEELRHRAEELAFVDTNTIVPESLVDLSPHEVRQVLHELRVHQIEVEMQNDELRQAQAALEASRARYADLYDLAPVGYFTLAAPGIIIEANLTAADMLGLMRSALLKQPLSRFIVPEDQDIYYLHATSLFVPDAAQVWEMRLQRQNGDFFWARLEARAVERNMDSEDESMQCHVVMSDITAIKQAKDALHAAQTQLAQHERLAVVGRLAAGIAHDFNNILSIILLNVQLGMRTPQITADLKARLDTIGEQSMRGADLIQQILDFGQRARLQSRPLDLVQFLQAQVKLWRRIIPEHIDIVLHTAEHPCIVNTDPTRMQQMFTNLILNARDAMPLGGKLMIDVDLFELTRSHQKPTPEMIPGEFVRISISDTGMGIPAEVLPHIFEPFFSTKPLGKGTGLGLAQVYGIIRQRHDHIHVQSTSGVGTTFTIYLSRWSGEIAATPVEVLDIPSQGTGEIILIAEDNVTLRLALSDTLERLNYRTLSVGNGLEALLLLEQQSLKIALVLSDLIMPEMGGQALFEAMRARGLDVPFIMLSGHAAEAEMHALISDGLFGWLPKPPDIHRLAQLLTSALHPDSASQS